MSYDTLQMTMLFDFYGQTLTEKQREYFELYYNEDLSLTEIAERDGISKQGVHDIIKRATAMLVEIEENTGLMQRWFRAREGAMEATRGGMRLPQILKEYFLLE